MTSSLIPIFQHLIDHHAGRDTHDLNVISHIWYHYLVYDYLSKNDIAISRTIFLHVTVEQELDNIISVFDYGRDKRYKKPLMNSIMRYFPIRNFNDMINQYFRHKARYGLSTDFPSYHVFTYLVDFYRTYHDADFGIHLPDLLPYMVSFALKLDAMTAAKYKGAPMREFKAKERSD